MERLTRQRILERERRWMSEGEGVMVCGVFAQIKAFFYAIS